MFVEAGLKSKLIHGTSDIASQPYKWNLTLIVLALR